MYPVSTLSGANPVRKKHFLQPLRRSRLLASWEARRTLKMTGAAHQLQFREPAASAGPGGSRTACSTKLPFLQDQGLILIVCAICPFGTATPASFPTGPALVSVKGLVWDRLDVPNIGERSVITSSGAFGGLSDAGGLPPPAK